MATPPRVILWDWDGTLVDSLAFLIGAHNHTRAHFGLEPIESADFAPYFGAPRTHLLAVLYGAERAAEAVAVLDAYMRAHRTALVRVLPGATEALEAGAAMAQMGVVSNARPFVLAGDVRAFGWERYFAAVVGAGEAAADKPAPDPLILALQRMGQEPGPDVWLVGDTANDVGCARAAGCTAVLIGAGDTFGAERVFPNLDGLRAFLIAMGG
ncbi:MAG TPA: HAD family hydrolase [Rhodospirillaceae bacterium]|nr:HAD family hydrolase [Rhodospirillaceae bacterium]